jgi:hypothetical protein
MQVVVTVDTEADDQWRAGGELRHRNLSCLPRFAALCRSYGIKPTYLCTHDVVTSAAFEEVVCPQSDAGQAEIGAHLHPWSNPPYWRPEIDGPDRRAYPSELPDDVFRQKLALLSEAIEKRSGRPPVSYRAGRWGLAASHVPILRELGFAVDSSVTPLVDWRPTPGAQRGGPDFTHAPIHPYHLGASDGGALLEVPMTIVMRSALLRPRPVRRCVLGHARVAHVLHHRLRVDTRPLWLRPFPDTTLEQLRDVCRAARRMKLPLVNLMLHSSELLPGGSQFHPTEASVEALYQKLEGLFGFFRQRGWSSATLCSFAEHYTP